MRDDRIEHLIRLLEKSDITELEIQEGWGRKIRLSKGVSGVVVASPSSLPAGMPMASPSTAAGENTASQQPDDDEGNLLKVVAPMVGTFYRATSPESPAFVEVGTRIDTGQTLCIIEAMKIMNEIPSEVQGSVRKILVENGQPVEFGQTLFLIEKPS